MVTKWFDKQGYRTFDVFGEYGKGTPPDVSLVQLLNIDHNNLKPFTKDLFDTSEHPEHFQAALSELSRGIRALFQFQDILDVTLDEDGSPLFNRHYAYYESLMYLRESVVSWLDKNVLAALTLLRPFLELAVLHIYWHLRCEKKNYKPYYDWMKHGKGKPAFKNALDYVFENLPAKEWVEEERLQELKGVVRNAYRTLCAYNHATNIDESIAAKSGGLGNIALESYLYYLELVNMLLRQLVYLFVLAYPMSLFPVEKHEKWAFSSGPMGLFFDKTNYAVLDIYISSHNTAILKRSLGSVADVKLLTEWFDSFRSLTPEEINADWERFAEGIPGFNKGNANDLPQRLAIAKSFNRSVGWALNYVVEHREDNEIPDEILENLRERIIDW